MRAAIHAGLAALLIAATSVGAQLSVAKTAMSEATKPADYAAIVPENFGEWTLVPSIRLVTPVEPDSLEKQIYGQMVGRAYTNPAGDLVMLLVAYGPLQTDKLQLHRPEACYIAEGFRVSKPSPSGIALDASGPALPVQKLYAQREGRSERITYWMRVGDDVVSTVLGRQWTKLRYGLTGVIPDGVLVRVSTINRDEASAEEIQTRFVRDLFNNMRTADLKHLVGAQPLRTDAAQAPFTPRPAKTGG